jgi:hypothetical protein
MVEGLESCEQEALCLDEARIRSRLMERILALPPGVSEESLVPLTNAELECKLGALLEVESSAPDAPDGAMEVCHRPPESHAQLAGLALEELERLHSRCPPLGSVLSTPVVEKRRRWWKFWKRERS